MNIAEFARKREVQILAVFGAVVIGGYYFWLKRQKDQLKWASADGQNKLLKATDPAEKCKKGCAGSSNYNECMYHCVETTLNQTA